MSLTTWIPSSLNLSSLPFNCVCSRRPRDLCIIQGTTVSYPNSCQASKLLPTYTLCCQKLTQWLLYSNYSLDMAQSRSMCFIYEYAKNSMQLCLKVSRLFILLNSVYVVHMSCDLCLWLLHLKVHVFDCQPTATPIIWARLMKVYLSWWVVCVAQAKWKTWLLSWFKLILRKVQKTYIQIDLDYS